MRRLRIILVLLYVVSVTCVTEACNIPVFRYALERWEPDRYELLAFHRDELNQADTVLIKQIQSRSETGSGKSNYSVTVIDLDDDPEPWVEQVWSSQVDATLPWCVVRCPVGQGSWRYVWQGSLTDFNERSFDKSPSRNEITKRLLAGEASVWVVVPGDDDSQTATVLKTLNVALSELESRLELPAGIGLPGSELYSDVPLTLDFSVLKIDPKDELEQQFIAHLTAFAPDSNGPRPTLIAPVFGRGRALAVLTGEELDGAAIGELGEFLCGACSCQVKRMNPGFDLLTATDWAGKLFGENASAVPIDPLATIDVADLPTLVMIPPGNSSEPYEPAPLVVRPPEDERSDREVAETPAAATIKRTSSRFLFAAGGFAGIVVMLALGHGLSRP